MIEKLPNRSLHLTAHASYARAEPQVNACDVGQTRCKLVPGKPFQDGLPRFAECSAAAIAVVLLASSCLRVTAPGELELGSDAEERATLEVDLDVEWIALECERLSRRIIIKPARGRVVLRGLPAGRCHAQAERWLPCEGSLGAGQVTFLDPDLSVEIFGGEAGTNMVCGFFAEEERHPLLRGDDPILQRRLH